MSHNLTVYIPQDRRRALAQGDRLPDRTRGAALLADISGFTPLTESLTQQLGPRQGSEELTQRINAVYDGLIGDVERYGGSVISFAGDAVICWFDQDDGRQALSAAFAMHQTMLAFPELWLKVAAAAGPARRFVVGDPNVQLIDVLAGAALDQLTAAEQLARKGETLLDEATAAALSDSLSIIEWRTAGYGSRFAVLKDAGEIAPPAVERAVESPPLSAETLQPWILPAVFQREQSGRGAFLTELRPAVALFLQFSGVAYDEDDAGWRLDSFTQAAQAALTAHGGTLLQLIIGDKGSYLYAAFGAPVTHEDDIRRALKAARELQTAVAQLQFLDPPRIGISQGMMRAGAYGGHGRRTYGVLGDGVNLAARLMSRAEAGQILVSDWVQTAVADSFLFAPGPPLPWRGQAQSLSTFTLVGPRRPSIHLQEPTYASPIVGREAELALLQEKMERALGGQGQVVGVVAEAGLGKSRLAAEAIQIARRLGFKQLCGGACQSDGVNSPYLLWKPICRALFDVEPDLPLGRLQELLTDKIKQYAPERLAAWPLLGQVLELPYPLPDNDFTRGLEPKFRKSALHALLEDYLKGVARDEPIFLVAEDTHWIDALSHDLLTEIGRIAERLPLFIIMAYRPPQLLRLQAPRLEGLPHFSKIELAELSPAEAEQAVRARLSQLYPADDAPSAFLLAKITARAQGNPFYLEELLNYLHDRGLNPRDPADIDKLELPDTLHTLVLSRIDQLPERQKTTLRVASVIGRQFRAAWLSGYYPTLGAQEQVKADLDDLAALDITPLDAPEPEAIYLFKHIITHEAAYESLPHTLRSQLHEQFAHYLEETQTAVPLDMLAFHYGRSPNLIKQYEYFRKAADAAQTAFANETALDYYQRLAPLLTKPADQIELHWQRGAVLERLGHWSETADAYKSALSLSEQIADAHRSAQSRWLLGKLARLQGEFAAALVWLQESRAAFAALNDRLGLGRALIETGMVLLRQGAYDLARERLTAGLDLARAMNDLHDIALALNNLGIIALDQGDYPKAETFYQESLALRRQVGDKWGVAASLINLAGVARSQGDYAAAQALNEESLPRWREMGSKQGLAAAYNNLGNVASDQGNYLAAQGLYEQSLILRREMGDKWGVALSLANLGELAWNLGDFARAQSDYEESLAIAEEIGNRRGICEVWSKLGLLYYDRGELAAARRYSQRAIDLARELMAQDELGYALTHLGHVCLAENDPAQARTVYQEAYDLRLTAEQEDIALEPLAGLARAALAQGETAVALTHVEQILAYLAEKPLTGVIYPFWVHLTCLELLRAVNDPRVGEMGTAVYQQLQTQAAKLPAGAQRTAYLAMSAHRQIVALCAPEA